MFKLIQAVSAFDSIKILENGVEKTLFVVNPTKHTVVVDGTLTTTHDGGNSGILSEKDAIDPEHFYTPKLYGGGSVQFDVNLS